MTIHHTVTAACTHLNIGLVILDFDGVLTDKRVHVMEDGREVVACHRGDGWGISQYLAVYQDHCQHERPLRYDHRLCQSSDDLRRDPIQL